jgi:hypothetical protein
MSGAGCRMSGFRFWVSGFRFRVSGFDFQIWAKIPGFNSQGAGPGQSKFFDEAARVGEDAVERLNA